MTYDVRDSAGAATSSMNVPRQGNVRSRRLLLLERTMYRDGQTPFASVFSVQLLGRLEERRLRQALACLQAKHPLLCCVIEQGPGGPRFVSRDDAAPIPLRIVERRREDDWETEVRREWVAPFDASRDPLLRVVWLRASEVSELVLIGHHCICDGQSGMTLLRDCLSAYDDPLRDIGTYDALGAIEDIVPSALLQDRSFQRRVRWKTRALRLMLLLKRGHGAHSGPHITADQMYFHRWSIDAAASRALTERCSAEGVSVLAAMSVAFLLAFRGVRGARALHKAYAMVNARRFMPLLRSDALFGIAPGVPLSMKGLPLAKSMSADSFWDCARAIKADLMRRVDRLGSGIYDYLVGLEGLHDLYARLVGDTESAPAVRHVTLSNMGRLELPQRYKNFWVEAVYSPLVMVSPTPANTVVLSSFAGQLELAIVTDEQSLPPVQAMAIRRQAMEILQDYAGMPAPYQPALAGEPSTLRDKRKMNSFGLIFVLYEPTEEFLNNLVKARAFCPTLVAVDNSPEADLRLHEYLREQGMCVIFNRNRGGLAGAYNRGAEVLLEQKCEVIFLLDQDSDIDASFFEKMMQACRELDTDEFLVGPKIYEINLEKCMPAFQPGKYLPERLRIDDRNEGLFPSLCIISSGSAISAAAYRKLGAFREDYFIEYIDIEYSLRAVEQNVPVYMNAAVTMRQITGKIERHGNKYTTNHAAWRRYYGARNAVHCLYLHRACWGLHWVSGLLAFLQVLRVLQYEPQKVKKITAITCGYLDGLLGRLGTFEDRHPRIAAFCKRSAPKRRAMNDSSSEALTGEKA